MSAEIFRLPDGTTTEGRKTTPLEIVPIGHRRIFLHGEDVLSIHALKDARQMPNIVVIQTGKEEDMVEHEISGYDGTVLVQFGGEEIGVKCVFP